MGPFAEGAKVYVNKIPFPLDESYRHWGEDWKVWLMQLQLHPGIPRIIALECEIELKPGYNLERLDDRELYVTRWVHHDWLSPMVPTQEEIKKYVSLNFKEPSR